MQITPSKDIRLSDKVPPPYIKEIHEKPLANKKIASRRIKVRAEKGMKRKKLRILVRKKTGMGIMIVIAAGVSLRLLLFVPKRR